MKMLRFLLLAIALPAAAQVPTQIPISGAFGTNGDFCLLGCVTINLTSSADYTPTVAERGNRVMTFTSSTLSAPVNIIMPSINADHVFINSTTGGQTLTFKTAGGTGVQIASGASLIAGYNGLSYVGLGALTSPGGTSGQVQTNNSGNFGGISLAGTGTKIPTSPTTNGVSGNFPVFDSAGGIIDSTRAPAAVGTANQFYQSNGTLIQPQTMSGDSTLAAGGAVTNTGLSGTSISALTGLLRLTSGVPSIETNAQLASAIQVSLQTLASCTTGTAYSPFSGTCISVGGSITHYYTSTTFTGIAPASFTPTHSLDVCDPAATTSCNLSINYPASGQSGDIFDVAGSSFQVTQAGKINQGGQLLSYQGLNTAGWGMVMPETDLNSLATARTTAISTPITLVTPQPFAQSPFQMYRVNCYGNVNTAVASSAVNFFLNWTDNSGGTVRTSSAYTLSTVSTTNNISFTQIVDAYASGGTVPVISLTSTLVSTGQSYNIDCMVERLR